MCRIKHLATLMRSPHLDLPSKSDLRSPHLQPSTGPSSANVSSPGFDSRRVGSRSTKGWIWEAFSILLLLAMVVYFLKVSWRKWPDPIVDSGPQLYAIWQTSEGAEPYHDFAWNYGPFSLLFN